jgi:hypothetical protein
MPEVIEARRQALNKAIQQSMEVGKILNLFYYYI